ncbi:27631_t:CDS:1, partial [Dentiscutata erythropus]
ILESLNGDTKKYIMEWVDTVREKYISDNDLGNDDNDNPIYYGDPLLIIEWDETGLVQ